MDHRREQRGLKVDCCGEFRSGGDSIHHWPFGIHLRRVAIHLRTAFLPCRPFARFVTLRLRRSSEANSVARRAREQVDAASGDVCVARRLQDSRDVFRPVRIGRQGNCFQIISRAGHTVDMGTILAPGPRP